MKDGINSGKKVEAAPQRRFNLFTGDPKESTPLPGVDWKLRQRNFVRRFLNALERISLVLEWPVQKWVGRAEFNPLYHTGTITIFLLLVILATGVYLTMFYQFGFEASYQAVAGVETNLVGRVVRALHRYASGAAVIAALLHGWRTFFMDRFRGPRWLAWVSGVVMAGFAWLIGISGYWMVMDSRAQVLDQTLVRLLQPFQWGQDFLVRYLTTQAAGTGWVFVLMVITVHLGLSALVGLFFYYHVVRLSRPKLLPPRYWMWALGGLLLLAALLAPLGMLPPANAERLPGAMDIDLWYLFYLPGVLRGPPAAFWGGVLGALVLASLLPWSLRRKALPPIVVNAERCTGCTLCAADCPYTAIVMRPRSDGKRHKYVAQVDAKLCVACGVCIGACQPLALSLGGLPEGPALDALLLQAAGAHGEPAQVVFACERHVQHLRPAVLGDGAALAAGQAGEVIIPLACIGMARPELAERALQAGAAGVRFVGCPPEDCANREGNLWLQKRLERQRLPKLRLAFAQAGIHSAWLAPRPFGRRLGDGTESSRATAYGAVVKLRDWRSWLPALTLLGAVLAVQVALSQAPYQPYPAGQALVEVALEHRSGYPLAGIEPAGALELGLVNPVRLALAVDGRVVFDETYNRPDGPARAFVQVALTPGEHELRLELYDRPGQSQSQVLFAGQAMLADGEVLRLHYHDVAVAGDPQAGRRLYNEAGVVNVGCKLCHALEEGVVLVGPSFAGVATRASGRVAGLTAEAYLRQSILEPDAYIVEGFPTGQMPSNYGELLTEGQIEDLLAFLLTLK